MTDTQNTQKKIGNTNQSSTTGNGKEGKLMVRRFCFTLNNYTSTIYTRVLEFLTKNCERWIVGKEVGTNGTPHLQGYGEFKNAKNIIYVSKEFLFNAHVSKANGNKENNYKYCSKDGIFEAGGFYLLNKKVDIMKKHYGNVEFKPWQQKIIDIVETPLGDNRSIYWFYEDVGNVGKSWFSKYLYCKYDCVLGGGKSSDILNGIKIYMENEEKDPRLMIMDIPRSVGEYVSYQILEKVKDGMAYSGKYEGGVVLLTDSPCIICFSNQLPDFSKCSEDRWKVFRIENDDLVKERYWNGHLQESHYMEEYYS